MYNAKEISALIIMHSVIIQDSVCVNVCELFGTGNGFMAHEYVVIHICSLIL